MQWFLMFMKKYEKEGIFIQRIGIQSYITVFKPEYLEVNKVHLIESSFNRKKSSVIFFTIINVLIKQ